MKRQPIANRSSNLIPIEMVRKWGGQRQGVFCRKRPTCTYCCGGVNCKGTPFGLKYAVVRKWFDSHRSIGRESYSNPVNITNRAISRYLHWS